MERCHIDTPPSRVGILDVGFVIGHQCNVAPTVPQGIEGAWGALLLCGWLAADVSIRHVVLDLHQGIRQLHDIAPPQIMVISCVFLCSTLVTLHMRLIAAFGQHGLEDIGKRGAGLASGSPPIPDDLPNSCQPLPCSVSHLFSWWKRRRLAALQRVGPYHVSKQHLSQPAVLLGGPYREGFHSPGSDFPCRDVDDTPQGHVVPRVGHQPHVCHNVLHLLALPEITAGEQPVRHPSTEQTALIILRLLVCVATHGHFSQWHPLLLKLQYLFQNTIRLIVLAVILHVGNLHANPLHSLQREAVVAAGSFGHQRICCSADRACGPVVVPQMQCFQLGKVIFQVNHVARPRAPPTVDALVWVADHKQPLVVLG
mmetsp:Transcript_9570/g.27387  ORF Transcript_9570/g.27387 Transcript_9570/m.27387 type:complete len:369 (-) Transcript_9570:89-1195(-)